jgi:hypothetical protein
VIKNFILAAIFLGSLVPVSLATAQVPSVVIDPVKHGYTLQPDHRVYALSVRQLYPSVIFSAAATGLQLDLGDSTLFGRLHYGPADFDYVNSDYFDTRFRSRTEIKKGKTLLEIASYLKEDSRSNVNHWTTSGAFGFRLELVTIRDGAPITLGIFDGRVDFRKTDSGFSSPLSIVEGPIVGCIQSDHPTWMKIEFETDRMSIGQIELEEIGVYPNPTISMHHEITIGNLQPSHQYRYRAIAIVGTDSVITPWMSFKTAPVKGKSRVVFAYSGDGRATTGGGENEYIGVNRTMITQIAKQVYRRGAKFFLFNGDMIGGSTSSTGEFTLMLKAFKTTFSGFLHSVPLYCAMGNHEALFNSYAGEKRKRLEIDKYPYDRVSAEAIMAHELIQPSDGPQAAPGMPPYTRNVYAFQYGAVKSIILNNDYWSTSTNMVGTFGGSPLGYMLPDQVKWFEHELDAADADPTVQYIVIMAHKPFFPNGGHVSDAMWHFGNNNIRAYHAVNDTLIPYEYGIIDMRNMLWERISRSKKIAAVLGSDEHSYHRSLITNSTPVGVPAIDDLNHDGILNDGRISPDAKYLYPTWFLVCGGAGAPYYTQEPSPWSGAVRKFTAQNNYFIFTADEKKIGFEVFNANGQLLDAVDDLLAGRKK